MIPTFANSQQAVAWGRTHPEAIPELQRRARIAEEKMNARSILKDWTAALRWAFVLQLYHECIEAAEHPERLTPLERLERERK